MARTAFRLLYETISLFSKRWIRISLLSLLCPLTAIAINRLLIAKYLSGKSEYLAIYGIFFSWIFVFPLVRWSVLSLIRDVFIPNNKVTVWKKITKFVATYCNFFALELIMCVSMLFAVLFGVFYLPAKYMALVILSGIVAKVITWSSLFPEWLEFGFCLVSELCSLIAWLAVSIRWSLAPCIALDKSLGCFKSFKWSWHKTRPMWSFWLAGEVILWIMAVICYIPFCCLIWTVLGLGLGVLNLTDCFEDPLIVFPAISTAAYFWLCLLMVYRLKIYHEVTPPTVNHKVAQTST